MKPIPRPKAPARLQRFILWLGLTLACAGEVAAGVMKRFRAGHRLEAHLHALVPRLAQGLVGVLLIQALVLAGRATFPVHKRFGTLRQKCRALFGAMLRRRLRGRTLGERIANLIHILKHRAPLVRWLARRIVGGLRRTHIAPPRAERVVLPCCALAIAGVDSS